MSNLRILIADDEQLARERLRALLPQDISYEIVAECASGTEAVEAIRREKPDVAFLDMQMPGCDGLKVVEVPIPTYYGEEICRVNGIPYAMNCVRETAVYALRHRWRTKPAPILN